jgi:hypothetical protein
MELNLIHGQQKKRSCSVEQLEFSSLQLSIILTSIKFKIHKAVEALGKLLSEVRQQQKYKAEDHILVSIRVSIIVVCSEHTSTGLYCNKRTL